MSENFTDIQDDDVTVETVATKEILSITMAELFSDDECNKIISSLVEELWMPIKVVGDQNLHKGARQKLRGDVSAFPFDPIRAITKEANSKVFDFSLLGIIDQDYPQVFKYEQGDYHDFHVEINPLAPTRKLTFILNLSDTSEYTGGEIEFLNTVISNSIANKKGTIYVFPSFLPYKINKVTSGTKNIIIGHIHGPLFR